MKNRKVINIVLLFVLIIVILTMPACAMPTISRFSNNEPGVEEIFRSSSTISVSWNYDDVLSIDHYNLYYKVHKTADLNTRVSDTSNWILLDTVLSASPAFEISHDLLGDGNWDFGVTVVDSDGIESEIHSSLDHTAFPVTGWFLTWITI